MTARDLLLKARNERVAELLKERDQHSLNLALLEATIPVFKQHGQTHPSLICGGDTAGDYKRRLATIAEELTVWEEASAIIAAIPGPDYPEAMFYSRPGRAAT